MRAAASSCTQGRKQARDGAQAGPQASLKPPSPMKPILPSPFMGYNDGMRPSWLDLSYMTVKIEDLITYYCRLMEFEFYFKSNQNQDLFAKTYSHICM